MAWIEQNARWRGRYTCVKYASILRGLRWLHRKIAARKHPHIRDISPRMARDIGMHPADIAVHQHRLPSQHDHHPRG